MNMRGASTGATGSGGWHSYAAFLVVSQGLNAGTNFLLVILLARTLSSRAFGLQALALTVYPLVLSFFRGAYLEPAVVHGVGRGTAGPLWRETWRVALLCGLATAAIPIAGGGPVGVACLVGVGAGTAVMEESARWLLAKDNRPQGSALADAAWALFQVGLLAAGLGSALVVAGGWAAGGVVSVLVAWGMLRRGASHRAKHLDESEESASSSLRARHAPAASRRMTRNWHWGMEHLTAASTPQLVLLLGPLTGGVLVSGAISAAMSVTGVANVLAGGAHQMVAGRLRGVRSAGQMRVWALRIGVLLALVVAMTSVPLLWLPSSMGQKLLGATWAAARAVLPWIIVQKVATSLALGPILVTRRLPTYRVGVWMRLPLTGLTVLGAIVGAALGGPIGASQALAAGAVASVVMWAVMLKRITAEGRVDASFEPEVTPSGSGID